MNFITILKTLSEFDTVAIIASFTVTAAAELFKQFTENKKIRLSLPFLFAAAITALFKLATRNKISLNEAFFADVTLIAALSFAESAIIKRIFSSKGPVSLKALAVSSVLESYGIDDADSFAKKIVSKVASCKKDNNTLKTIKKVLSEIKEITSDDIDFLAETVKSVLSSIK